MSRDDTAVDDARVTAVLLAAGGGARFVGSGHKLLAKLPANDDRPVESVFSRSLAATIAASIGDVVVVTGCLNATQLGIAEHAAVRVIANERWADGQMTSVHAGLAAASSPIVVVGLADQPGITADAWRRVATAATSGAAIAVATYNGRRGNPVALHNSIWHLLARSGDMGARGLMRIRGDLVVPVSCEGQPHDIDTVEDLHAWQNN